MKPVLLIALLLLVRVSAVACSCMEPPPPAEKLKQASAVFIGKVISKRESIKNINLRTYKFVVQEVFKGDLKSNVFVSSNRDGAACGVVFSEDKTYLIYTYGSPKDLRTNMCSANQDADSPAGQNEIKALRALNSQTSNP